MQKGSPRDWTKDTNTVHLYNPLKRDISFQYRDDENKIEEIIVFSKSIADFPAHQANIVLKRIADEVINERNLGYVTPAKRAEVEKEIVVSLEPDGTDK